MSQPIVVMISANAEWRAVRARFSAHAVQRGPYGEWLTVEQADRPCVFVQGGWGKISAAASTQWAIERFSPGWVANLGTCGGLAGQISRWSIVLAERTLVYDIVEQMGDPQEAIDHYTVDLDLGWLSEPYPLAVTRALLVSADRDIVPAEVPMLIERYGAVAADWESGAIAWCCARNGLRCLILRGVTDLVSPAGGQVYDALEAFHSAAETVMNRLLDSWEGWVRSATL